MKKELAKWELAAIPVEEFFKRADAHRDKYASFDDDHHPTTTANGEPLSNAATKACKKEMKKHKSNREQLMEKSNGDIEHFLEDFRAQIDAL